MFRCNTYSFNWLQADVDLVSIMARTGFLPEQPLSPSGPAQVSQGSNTTATVASSRLAARLNNITRSTSLQLGAGGRRPAPTGLADADSQQRPLAAALPFEAKQAAKVCQQLLLSC